MQTVWSSRTNDQLADTVNNCQVANPTVVSRDLFVTQTQTPIIKNKPWIKWMPRQRQFDSKISYYTLSSNSSQLVFLKTNSRYNYLPF